VNTVSHSGSTEITLNDTTKDSRTVAQRAADGRQAMADYEAQAAAVRAKTERLRALRLAREATQPPAAAKRAPSKSAGGTTSGAKSGSTSGGKKGKRSAPSLSQWLSDQEKGGRRT
jgi:hypothetical protein